MVMDSLAHIFIPATCMNWLRIPLNQSQIAEIAPLSGEHTGFDGYQIESFLKPHPKQVHQCCCLHWNDRSRIVGDSSSS